MFICQMGILNIGQNHWTMKAEIIEPWHVVYADYINIEVNHSVIPFHNLEIHMLTYVKWAFGYRTKSLDHEDRNHWTMTCRSCYIEVNYCVIPFQNLEIWCSYVNLGFRYRTKSLDHDDRNHCTMTCRSCWLSVHDPQINVAGSNNVYATIYKLCFYNRKVE